MAGRVGYAVILGVFGFVAQAKEASYKAVGTAISSVSIFYTHCERLAAKA